METAMLRNIVFVVLLSLCLVGVVEAIDATPNYVEYDEVCRYDCDSENRGKFFLGLGIVFVVILLIYLNNND